MGKLLDEYRSEQARKAKEARKQWTPEDEAKVSAFITELFEGKNCPHCHTPLERKEQVGCCVYGVPCGCRLYHGSVDLHEPAPEAKQS